MHKNTLLACAVLMLATPAWAVFKCKDTVGKTTFQERPCEATGTQGKEIQAIPAAGHAASSTPSQPYIPRTSEEMHKENRLLSLTNTEISRARNEITGASAKCDREMTNLSNRKANASNNLAGATWEQSLSAEMQAIATRCSAEQSRLNSNLDRLLAEKQQLEIELQNKKQ